MLMPDVTEIINDPEIGGGQPFQVRRVSNTRVLGGVTRNVETIDLIGNIQPQDMSSQSSTVEDTLNETIVIYANFGFQTGENTGDSPFTGADEILYDGKVYRVTSVNNWSEWGFSIANATRVRDYIAEPDPEPEQGTETGEATQDQGQGGD